MTQNNSHQWKRFSTSKVITFSPTSVPFMPGIGLILLGLVMFLAPKFFLAAVATFFVFLGVAACYVALKLLRFKRQVSKLAEELQQTVEIRAFHPQNDDIDITDFDDNKKTYLH